MSITNIDYSANEFNEEIDSAIVFKGEMVDKTTLSYEWSEVYEKSKGDLACGKGQLNIKKPGHLISSDPQEGLQLEFFRVG